MNGAKELSYYIMATMTQTRLLNYLLIVKGLISSMITKAEGRLKPVYLIKNSKCLCVSKDIIILISLLSFVSAFLSACQKSDYDSNFYYTSGAVQLSTEATQIPNNDELRWTWCIESDKYIDLFFVDLDLIAAKESDGQYIIINTNGDTVIPFKYSSVSRFYDGIAVVKDNGNSFFIDKKGENVFDEVYEEAYSFSNALAAVKKKDYGDLSTEPAKQ